jgi:hypothetical protein
VASCEHPEIEVHEKVEDGMHWSGWACLSCDHLATGECHHQSWCREDFCGADPVVAGEPERVLLFA